MSGYTGTSAHVDLTSGRVDIHATPEALREDFLGGRGFGVAMVRDAVTFPWNDPAMPLVFATGPLVGTAAPTSGRSTVVSRSPLTGTVFDCSVGGRFGTTLKRAGFDMIVVTGCSRGWVFIRVEDGRITIEDATALAGKNISELPVLGDSSAAIGRAGERAVRFASIVMDGRYCAGRGGLGAVMGGKKLKAIAVSGTREIEVADPAELDAACRDISRLLRASPAVFGEFGIAELGTAAFVDLLHARRMEPTRNFRETFFNEAQRYSGYAMKAHYASKKTGCAGCAILCKKVGSRGEVIPEFDSASHLGALNGCGDLERIVQANALCNDYGMDTVSAGATIACHAEIEGLEPGPGELCALLEAIGDRKPGLGDALAEGSYRYAASRGRPEASMTVKKLELPAYDPRGAYGTALAYATSNRGGCHLRAYPISHEVLRKPVPTDRFSFEGKARMVRFAEDQNAVVDSLTACKFVFFAAGIEEYARAVNAVTGGKHDIRSLLGIGRRVWDLERDLNRLNGFTRDDDDLPARFFNEPGTSGESISIPPLDRAAFLEARERYYRIRKYL